MNKYIFLVILLILSPACSSEVEKEWEMSSKIESPESHKIFIKRLDEKGITFRVGEDRSVFYPESERDEVHKIFVSVLGIKEPALKGVSVKSAQGPDVAAELVRAKIPFEVIHQDGSTYFKWPEHLNEKAFELVTKVLKEHGV